MKAKSPTPAPGLNGMHYRVMPVMLRIGTMVRSGYQIQVRPEGSRTRSTATINDVPLHYTKREIADRHCAWLTNPVGTQLQWDTEVVP